MKTWTDFTIYPQMSGQSSVWKIRSYKWLFCLSFPPNSHPLTYILTNVFCHRWLLPGHLILPCPSMNKKEAFSTFSSNSFLKGCHVKGSVAIIKIFTGGKFIPGWLLGNEFNLTGNIRFPGFLKKFGCNVSRIVFMVLARFRTLERCHDLSAC